MMLSSNNYEGVSQVKDDTGLAARIYRFAAIIAVIIAVVPPLGYFWLSYQSQGNELLVESKLHAAFITQVIRSLPDDWRGSAKELIEQELTHSDLPEVRSIIDPHGNLITQTRGDLGKYVLTRSTRLYDGSGNLVGQVNVSHSLTPVIQKAWLVALGGMGLGVAIFTILYLLPLRALKRAIAALRKETEVAQENEGRLSVVIQNATEGIITLTPDGIVESFNAAAERMFGYPSAEIIGQNASIFMSLPESGNLGCSVSSTAIHREGNSFPIELSVSEARMKGVLQLICIVHDITERKQAEERLNRMANFDNLTKLPNRNLFHDRLSQALHRAERAKTLVALMFLDLDRFKNINDTLGHGAGDRLLQHVANMLRSCLRKTDTISRQSADGDDELDNATVARLGGDEFTLILEGLTNVESAALVANKIIRTFGSSPVKLGEHDIYASASIGIAVYPFDDTDKENLIKDADNAMYRSKELGRNTYQFYTRDLNIKVNDKFLLEAELRHALERNEFILYYQPKVDIDSGAIIGAEALLRWQSPNKGLVSPADFIPVLEDTGLIIPVGEWVLRTACAQNRAWQQAGIKPLLMAVNLSSRQFIQGDLVERISSILDETELAPQYLEVELTESLLMEKTEYNIATMAKIDELGVRISIDDFGTGYSSLSYLKRFPVHTLKIDQSFVSDLASNQDDVAIATAIIALGQSLHMTVIAEGVETREQLDLLLSMGCHQAQGYLLGRPMPADAFIEHISAGTALNYSPLSN